MKNINKIISALDLPAQPESGSIHWIYRILSGLVALGAWIFIIIVFLLDYLKHGYLPENWKDWIVTLNILIIAILFTAVTIKGRVPRVLAKYLLAEHEKN